jgi:sphingosine kinase
VCLHRLEVLIGSSHVLPDSEALPEWPAFVNMQQLATRPQAAAPVTDAPPGTTTIPLPVLSSLGGTPPAVPHTTEVLPAGWKLLDLPQVQLFALVNLPWIAPSYHFNPTGCLHHGYFNLIYTSHMHSRAAGLRMLMVSEEGGHVELAGVQVEGVRALVLEPLESGTTVMLDGEVVPFQPLYVEVHPGLCTVVVAPEWQQRDGEL